MQPVGGAQQNADPFRGGNHLARADQRQHVFGLVRQLADLHQIEKTGSSFDRMHGPKDTIDQFLIDLRSTLFDGQKVRLDGGQCSRHSARYSSASSSSRSIIALVLQ